MFGYFHGSAVFPSDKGISVFRGEGSNLDFHGEMENLRERRENFSSTCLYLAKRAQIMKVKLG